MKLKGSDLEFISQINRDGSGTSQVSNDYIKILNEEYFEIHCLSMPQMTFIAMDFNSFVVKIKPGVKLK